MHVDSRMHLCGILPACWPKFQELELQRPDDLQHFVITEQVEGTTLALATQQPHASHYRTAEAFFPRPRKSFPPKMLEG